MTSKHFANQVRTYASRLANGGSTSPRESFIYTTGRNWRRPNGAKKNSGVGLLEAVIYISILVSVATITIGFLIQAVNAYFELRAEREVLSNARLLLETIGRAISESQEVYSPTTRLLNNSGQLSLITPTDATVEHKTAYLDFWVSNGFLHMKKEGQATTTLSSASVKVNRFWIERINQSLERDAVRIILDMSYNQGKFPASTTLYSTTALRGKY